MWQDGSRRMQTCNSRIQKGRYINMTVVIWLIAAAVLAGLEVLTQGLTTIWFAGGALVAAIFCGLGAPLLVQILVFGAVSIALLILTRPLALRYLNSRTIKTNVESLIGKTCIVIQSIDNLSAKGQVSVNGQTWTARSTEDSVQIAEGSKAEIVSVQGVKLLVKKIGGEEL